MIYKPHEYQKEALQHILDEPRSALFLDLGLGKSSITLTALELLINGCEVHKPLIIAPKRVCSSTWPNEIKKWDHTSALTISVIQGTEKQRIAAYNKKADIYAVSRDNCNWLVQYCKKLKKWPYDTLIIDELSSFKNPSSQRFKALRKILPYLNRIVGLTATPASNNLLGLWAEIYLLDQGERLEPTYGAFKDKYFNPGAKQGHVVFNYVPKKGAEQQIYDKLRDICLSMKAKDYLELPERIDIYEEIELESFERYEQFKKTEVLKMGDGFELTPVNAAVFYSLLLQYSNGAIYRYHEDGSRYYEVVDHSKLNALVDDIEFLQGEPVFIFCQLQSDFTRIKEAIPQAVKIESDEDIDNWNKGLISVAMAHGLSVGHGLNLQDGGHHIIHFGLNWDLEVYDQSVGRLARQGQTKPVINKHLVGKGTVEELMRERLGGKKFTQDELMSALARYLK